MQFFRCVRAKYGSVQADEFERTGNKNDTGIGRKVSGPHASNGKWCSVYEIRGKAVDGMQCLIRLAHNSGEGVCRRRGSSHRSQREGTGQKKSSNHYGCPMLTEGVPIVAVPDAGVDGFEPEPCPTAANAAPAAAAAPKPIQSHFLLRPLAPDDAWR